MSKCEWQGDVYDRVSGPQKAFGEAVLERLQLDGDETVLDAGCGSGRVTELLLERLPRGRVIAVDQSPSMVEAARERLSGPVRVEVQDLLALTVPEPLDAVLSTSTFHWIDDHGRLFERLHAALRPGGRLVAQCGGEGNITELRSRGQAVLERAPYAEHMLGWRPPWNYAGAEKTRERLLGAGFTSAECWLEPSPVTLEQPREFLPTVIFAPHIQRLPEQLHESFIDALLAELGEPVVVDYVRLNMDAVA